MNGNSAEITDFNLSSGLLPKERESHCVFSVVAAFSIMKHGEQFSYLAFIQTLTVEK